MDRANYVAALWKNSMEANIELPEISHHGWNNDGSVCWINKAFPEDLVEMV